MQTLTASQLKTLKIFVRKRLLLCDLVGNEIEEGMAIIWSVQPKVSLPLMVK